MKHNRKPKKILKCWIFKTSRPVGRQQECIETSLSKMITNSLELKDNLNNWMTTDKTIWQRRQQDNRDLHVINRQKQYTGRRPKNNIFYYRRN